MAVSRKRGKLAMVKYHLPLRGMKAKVSDITSAGCTFRLLEKTTHRETMGRDAGASRD